MDNVRLRVRVCVCVRVRACACSHMSTYLCMCWFVVLSRFSVMSCSCLDGN
jgi:hypothetical protein